MDAARSMQAVAALRRVYGTHAPRQVDIQSIRAQIADAAQRLTQQVATIRDSRDCDHLAAIIRGLQCQVQSLRAQIGPEGAREDGSRAA